MGVGPGTLSPQSMDVWMWCITCSGMIGGHIVLVVLNEFFKRFFSGRNAAKNIQREREIFRRWSRRNVEDRFTL